MVYYKPILPKYKEEPYDRQYRSGTYWMLGDYINKTVRELKEYLAAHGYKHPKGANKEALRDAVGRCQRGLLSYEKYGGDELRGFFQARKLSLSSKNATVASLARALEQADDDATFPRFMELPAELRNNIYELHFRDYDKISTQHRQPPLTMVPQIRAESLPLFYGCVTFTWDLSLDTNFCIYAHTFTGDSHSLTRMPTANLAQIKNFKLHWTHVSRFARDITNRRVDFSAEISQCNNTKKMATIINKRIEPLSPEVEDVVRLALDNIGYWDMNWKLQGTHLIAFRDAVNKALRETMFGH